MQIRDSLEERLINLIEFLNDDIEVYESFFRLNKMKPEEEKRWKEMYEEHKYLKQLRLTLQDQLLRLESML